MNNAVAAALVLLVVDWKIWVLTDANDTMYFDMNLSTARFFT